MTLLAGLVICRTLRKVAGVPAKVKWPNDVVIGSRKICGILTEMGAEMEQVEYVVIGPGVNIHEGSYPDDIRERAITLEEATGKKWNRAYLMRLFLEEFEHILDENQKNGLQTLLPAYRDSCVTLGRTVYCDRGGTELRGTAVDITEEGELVVETETGERAIIYSGEVSVQGVYGHA